MTQLSWGAKVSPAFIERLLQITDGFGWARVQASWLMACIAFETGTSFSPSIKNGAGSGATGLIQFMPKTAIGLSTTTEALAKMTAVEQLDYVERYFRPYHKRIKTLSDMYMAILMPKYIARPLDEVIFSGGIAYRQNSGLDSNRDGVVTKGEASDRVRKLHEKGLLGGNVATI